MAKIEEPLTQLATRIPKELHRRLKLHCMTNDIAVMYFVVRDAGIGLDPENLARLINAFFTTKPGGMGIGLSISRTIHDYRGTRRPLVGDPARRSRHVLGRILGRGRVSRRREPFASPTHPKCVGMACRSHYSNDEGESRWRR